MNPAASAQQLKLADGLFAAARFVAAEKIYDELADCAALYPDMRAHIDLRRGYLALLANRLDSAQSYLAHIAPDHRLYTRAAGYLAEAAIRRDDYARAAPLLAHTGRAAKAAHLCAFSLPPYRQESASATLEFVAHEPLPAVVLAVNGKRAWFVLDTGTGDTLIDSEFAQAAGIALADREANTFTGGSPAPLAYGSIDSLVLGAVTLAQVPVVIGAVGGLFAPYYREPIAGIIGLALLARFCATLDFPRAQLRLAPTGAAGPAAGVTIPMWLAEDYHAFAWGAVARDYPVFMLIDTGQSGFAFAASLATVQGAGLRFDEGHTGNGTIGDDDTRAVPLALTTVSLGETAAARRDRIAGVYEPRFPIEYRFGFRVGGLLAYDFFRPYALTLDFARMHITLADSP